MAARAFIVGLAVALLGCQASGFLTAQAQAQASNDDGGSSVLRNIMALQGVVLPSPDAGVTQSSCKPYGVECGAALDCCSLKGSNGKCDDGASSCLTPGTLCEGATQCCSAFCELGVCR